MLQTLRNTKRALALSGLLVLASGTTRVMAQNGAAPYADSASLVAEFPMVLVYHGIGLFYAEDYDGAINAWQGYLDRAGKDADTASVNEMIREAWVREYPLALVYDGITHYFANEMSRAVASWERYLELAPGKDSAEVRILIARAQVMPDPDELARIELSVRSYLARELATIPKVDRR